MSPLAEAPARSASTAGAMSVVLEVRHAELAVVANPLRTSVQEPQAGARFVILASLCDLS
jgi:hypothetical protein